MTAANVGSLAGQLGHELASAAADVDAASQLLAAHRTARAHALLDHALRWLLSFENRVGSLAGRRQIAPDTRARLITAAEALEADVRMLRDAGAAAGVGQGGRGLVPR